MTACLHLVGVSHHKTPVSVRERLAFRAEDLPRALGELAAAGFREAAILSTCNRVEVIGVAKPESPNAAASIRTFLSQYHGVEEKDFSHLLYSLNGEDAARHVFEVSASLDSQILGETEILAQTKEAYRVSSEAGFAGHLLRGLFERSFFLSKEVRSDGGIGRTQASVSSAAVALAKKVFEVEGRKVLVVGTGEMATGIVRALKAAGVAEILVASRTEERANEFAAREGGRACRMSQLPEHLIQVDIVLVSAAAPHFIIGPEQVRTAAAKRRGRSLCLIDISVPRNVDPSVHQLEDTFLYDIDDLEEVARDGRREREAVAERWRPRLAEEARVLLRELQDYGARDAAKQLIQRADAWREEVLRQVRGGGLDAKAVEEIERSLERLQGRILAGPLETLKQAAREGDSAEAATWVSRMFRLESARPVEEASAPEAEAGPAGKSAGPAVKQPTRAARALGDNPLIIGGKA